MTRIQPTRRTPLSRRSFLALTGSAVAASALFVACGDDDEDEAAEASPTQPSEPLTGRVLVGDVLDHALRSDEWSGQFGFVTFKLHTASVDDQPAYFIRTDASDQAFATAEKLVYVPKMASALSGGGAGLSSIYLFTGGVSDQPAVLSSAPHKSDYSPAFRVHRVSFMGQARKLGSVAAIQTAEGEGLIEVEQTDIVVNYPVVKWPGGEMPVDDAKDAYLGGGQLIEPVDVAGEKVTFKLHSCYPNTRYIVTDVSLPPMAEGMKIAPAGGADPLTAAGATAQILVFGNGVEGSGPMGFQKSITDTQVGEPAWSPYWDHYTFMWSNDQDASVLKSLADLTGEEQSGALTRVNGTPDTDGKLFMVNCPVPVSADVA